MEQILLKTVVETLVSEIWKYHWPQKMTKQGSRMPSLREQEAFSKELLFQSHTEDNMIYLHDGEGDTEKIPFYNYLLLINNKKNQFILTRTYWEIVGFQRCTEMLDYIIKNDYLWPAIVFVKVDERYEKVNCTYAYQRPGEKREYANLWKFYHPDDKNYETPERKKDYQYFVEINTLCEMEYKNNVECYLINTYSDIESCLHKKAMKAIWEMEEGKIPRKFKEEGIFTWNNEQHRYYIKIENNYIEFYFFNKAGVSYCYNRNEFSPLCEKFGSDCTKCCEFFEIEKKINVEVE